MAESDKSSYEKMVQAATSCTFRLVKPGDLDGGQLTLQNEIKELRKRIEECDEAMVKQVTTISLREDEIKKLKSQMVILKQQARDQEFKLQQLSSTSSGDSVDSGGSGARRLQEHSKKQAVMIRDLKGRIMELEETLEMTESNKTSFENRIQEEKDDREKVKDFENAKEEIEALKSRIDSLEHELTSTKKEATRLSEKETSGECVNKKCKDVRTRLHKLESEQEESNGRVVWLEKTVANQTKQIQELESAKNEAIGDIATARMEAEIYKADFLEERKDRERAWGELADLRKKKGGQEFVIHEERAQLYKEINDLKKEKSKLKTEHAGCKAKIQHQVETSRQVVGKLKEQVEKMGRERDEARSEVERKKTSKNQKIREYDKMKDQLSHASRATVKLTEQLEKVRKEKRDLEKEKRDLEKAVRRNAEKAKAPATRGGTLTENEPQQTGAEQLYGDERDRIESLQHEVSDLRDDNIHLQTVIATLMSIVRQEQPVILSPADSDWSLVSPTSEQINTESDPFQGDPNYIPSEPDPQPELGLRQHLERLNQLGPSLEPFEAGMGNFQQEKQKLGQLSGKASNTEPQALPNLVMDRRDNLQVAGVKSASGPVRRSRADSADQASNIPPEQQQGPPSTGGRHSTGEQPLRQSQENARGASRTLPALPQNNQPSSAKRPSTLGQYSTHANNFPKHPKAASHPIAQVPSNQSNAVATAASVSAKTQSVNMQTSLQFNTPISHPPSANLATQTSVRAKDSISTQTPTEKSTAKGGVEQSFSENMLVERIDSDISNMAADLQEEVSEKSELIITMEHKPFDENLVCPKCFALGRSRCFANM